MQRNTQKINTFIIYLLIQNSLVADITYYAFEKLRANTVRIDM